MSIYDSKNFTAPWIPDIGGVADLDGHKIATVASESHAILISAAPELQASLEMALIHLENGSETAEDLQELITIVKAALNKSKGE